MNREVVVTGRGIVSSIGKCIEEFERSLFAGASGVRDIRGALVPGSFPVPYAAWMPREEIAAARDSKSPKSWIMTEQATRQAIAGLAPEHAIDAVLYGTADGVTYEIAEEVLRQGSSAELDFRTVRSEAPLLLIRDLLVEHGLRRIEDRHLVSLNSACATGNQTIGVALHGLRAGRWDRCLVGGVDARCEPSNLLNFFLLGALCADDVPPHRASRPFSKDRSGFVRGEGAATLLLETREAAEARGAPILGVISGYACTSDAFRLTDGRDDGSSIVEAMRLAIADAGLSADDIGYVNAHGTSTPLNDQLETLALKLLFGERAYSVPVSSIKSQIGHSTIAASAIEAVACLSMLEHDRLAPTINYSMPDPECDLDYVPNESRAARVDHILSNSFGFGGQNTCLVVSRARP